MISLSNEQFCIAALDGDTEARNALVENNLRFIKRTAYEIWSAQQELNTALGIEINDLVQEGLWVCWIASPVIDRTPAISF